VKPPAPLRLLIVDDDAPARTALRRLLSDLGYDCHAAGDARDALEAHRSRPFDIVLSDWNMPGMDGIELCNVVRRTDEGRRHTHFILMTARPNRPLLVEGLRRGADDFITKPIDMDELEARLLAAQRVIRLHRSLARKNRSLLRDSERFFRQARLDPLTSVFNRLELDEDLQRLLPTAAKTGESACLAMCDVDHFKLYNDTFGHLAGDDVLRRVASSIKSALRHSDTVYRYGGEEFVVLLPAQSVAEASAAMERVRSSVQALGISNPNAPFDALTISIGIAALLAGDDPGSWLARADQALYDAKTSGRNRIAVSTRPAALCETALAAGPVMPRGVERT
jgi:diguanylate cyclase (GGDEF)-like protein